MLVLLNIFDRCSQMFCTLSAFCMSAVIIVYADDYTGRRESTVFSSAKPTGYV